MDPDKLDKFKVVELRAELQARGLDTRGVKAVLIERLKDALENEEIASSSGGIESNENSNSAVPSEVSIEEVIPTRRMSNRRTSRSSTRSPSPVVRGIDIPAQVLDPLLEDQVLSNPIPVYIEHSEAETPTSRKSRRLSRSATQSPPVVEMHTFEASTIVIKSIPEDENVAEEEIVPLKEAENETVDETNVELNEATDIMDAETQKFPINLNNIEDKLDVEVQIEITKETPAIEVNKEPESESNNEAENNRKRKHSEVETKSRSRSKSVLHEDKSRSKSHSKSRSKSRSRSKSQSAQRERRSRADESIRIEEDEPTIEYKQVGLSWYDSDLHLRIDPVSFNSARPCSAEIFNLVWSGARANYGVSSGKVCFEVRLSEESITREFRDEQHLRGFRCGFSVINNNLLLGDTEKSFGYCQSGKKVLAGEYLDYGEAFGLDDVIGCYLNLESEPAFVEFTKNGKTMGPAFEFNKIDILGENGALFPHVLTKGYDFQVNFADNENLLGNCERPKRMRKKVRTISEKQVENSDIDGDDNKEQDNNIKMEKINSSEIENQGNKESIKMDVDENEEKKEEDEKIEDEKIEDEKKEDEKKEDEIKEDPKNDIEEKLEKKDEENKEDEKKEDGKEIEKDKDSVKEDRRRSSDDSYNSKRRDSRRYDRNEDEYEEVEPEQRDTVELLFGYELIGLISEDLLVCGPQRPESRKECEVILMVGLPNSGKTYWVEKHLQENTDKRYDVIGPDALIAKMIVDGEPRRKVHKGTWDKLYEMALKSLMDLEDIANKRRRNVILDQTNVYASNQRRKMRGFGDFKRIAVVCIPNEEDFKRRMDEWKSDTTSNTYNPIKDTTLDKMKANFSLPSLDFNWFDEVRFSELSDDEAKNEVKKYNEEGKKAVHEFNRDYKRPRHDRYDDRRRRDDRRNDDYRSRWRNDRRPPMNRWGGGGGGSGGGGGGGSGGGGAYGEGYGRGYGDGYGRRGEDRYGGYERRDRYGGYGGSGGNNWTHNNRRYDDRSSRNSYGSGRYDSYSSRSDYRERYDRDRNGSSRRDGGSSRSGRDFRPGHRDNRTEDSRGGSSGYERQSSKYSSNDSYSNRSNTNGTNNLNQDKWNTQLQQGNWGSMDHQMTQQQTAGTGYWNFDQSQAYGQQQQQWPVNTADPRQQQQWMDWWQQQQTGSNPMVDPQQQQYWTQYAQYTTVPPPPAPEQTQPQSQDNVGQTN